MHGLEEEYPGDRHWLEFVALYKVDYLDENAYRLATIMNGRLDEAVIVYGKRGLVEAKWWIAQEVPALEGLRPIDCLSNAQLIKRLRTALMRMP